MNLGTISYEWTTKPGNSASVYPVDSTTMCGNIGTQGAAPGSMRGLLAGYVVSYTILCTDQNVTLYEEVVTGTDEDSSDWEVQGAAGTVTITAGTTTVREFRPLAPDFRIKVTAGGTAPTLMQMRIMLKPSGDFGS